jgi:hypothetical protein
MYTVDVDGTIIRTANNDRWGDHREIIEQDGERK